MRMRFILLVFTGCYQKLSSKVVMLFFFKIINYENSFPF